MLRLLSGLLLLALASFDARGQTSLVVVVLDDVSWDDVDQLATPSLDTLAARGRTYTSAYASALCSPSRYQLMFGRLPHRDFVGHSLVSTGKDPEDLGPPPERLSVATALRTHGYRTGLFGKWHVNNVALGQRGELARIHGFGTWRAGIAGNLTGKNDHYAWPRLDDGYSRKSTAYTTDAIESAFEAWWTATDGPKLAYVSFAAAHAPHQAAPASMLPEGHRIKPTLRARFESAVLALDHAIGRMAAYVDPATTLFVVVADNGTPQDVPPPAGTSPGYKLTQYQGGIRVPLWIAGPGVTHGVEDSLVQLVDLPTTLLDVAGCRPNHGFEDGRSLVPTLDGSAPSGRPWAFVQRFAPNGGAAEVLTRDDWALVWPDGWKVLVQDGGAPRAFDLSGDPGEARDLVETDAGAAKVAEAWRLRAEILGPTWPY